jgi:phage-related protein
MIKVWQQNKNLNYLFFYCNEIQLKSVNSFQKKTQKTPKTEIEKALKIKKEYESEKQYKNS